MERINHLANALAEMINNGIAMDSAIATLEIHEGMDRNETCEVISELF